MLRKIVFSSIVLGLLALTSCYPGSSRTLENTEIVFTDYEENYDFSTEKTYFLSEEVLSLDTNETVPESTRKAITDRIEIEMNKKGWTRVYDVDGEGIPTEAAAVVVVATAYSGTVEGISYWPGWGGWWGWGWGWGYGGVAVPYSYDTGTIYIDMLDRSSYDDENNRIDLVWLSTMNGVLSSSGFDTNNRIDRVITQAFEQSPYL